MIEKLEGIILTTVDYKESSLILNVLTKEYGLIGVIAKGCKKIKSPLRSVTSKMTYGSFSLIYKKNGLSILNTVDIIDNFKKIKKDITKISYSSYLLELSYQVYKQSDEKNIFDLLISSLLKIDEGFNPLVIMNILELKFLEYLGVMPILDSCYKCGSKDVITVSNGGYVCCNCYTNERIVDHKTIKMLRLYYYVDIKKISKVEVDDKIQNEINDFLDSYYELYTGLYLKSKKFINNLKNL